jgi:hypothetical protein
MVTRESIGKLMAGSAAARTAAKAGWEVLLVSSDAVLTRRIRRETAGLRGLRISSTPHGADALIRCARSLPDIVVFVDDLRDMSCGSAIAALRREFDSDRLPILCSSDNAELSRHGIELIGKTGAAGCRMVLTRIREMIGHTGNGSGVSANASRRRWIRREVSVPARIGIYPNRHPLRRRWGSAVLANVSRGGAFLNGITMDEGLIPSEPFRALVEVDSDPLPQWSATCQVLRLGSNGSVSAGMRFIRLSAENREKIARFCA